MKVHWYRVLSHKVQKYTAGIASALLAASLSGTPVFAAGAPSAAHPDLVALGDSITFGYDLGSNNQQPSPLAFPYLIGAALHDPVTDLGQPGWTSAQLLAALSTPPFQNALRQAGVVTIDIGSNDILGPAVKDGLLNPVNPPTSLTAAQDQQFLSAIHGFGKNLVQIILQVRRVAPRAQIVLYDIYDPIPPSAAGFYAISEHLVGAENAVIAGAALRFGLPVANAYGAFSGKLAQYLIPGNVHPSATGQQALASVGEEALQSVSGAAQGKGAFVFELLALLGQEPDRSGTSPFTDVPAHSFLWGYVHKALELGIVQPESSKVFGVHQTVTEGEAAQMAASLAGALPQGAPDSEQAAVLWALQSGLFGAIQPNRPMTLADELAFAFRLKQLESGGSLSAPPGGSSAPSAGGSPSGGTSGSQPGGSASGPSPSGSTGSGGTSSGAGQSGSAGSSGTSSGAGQSGSAGSSGTSSGATVPGSSGFNIPASWGLSSGAAAALSQALAASVSSPYQQSQGSLQIKMHFNLTKAGQQDPTAMAVEQSTAQTLGINLSADSQTVGGKRILLGTLTPVGGSATPGVPGGPVRVYGDGSKVYVNSGKGWVTSTSAQNEYALVNQMSAGGGGMTNLAAQMFSSMTAQPAQNGYEFTGTLDFSHLGGVLSPLLTSLGSTGSTGAGSSTGVLEQDLLRNMKGTMRILVQNEGGSFRITSETADFSSTVSPTVFPMSTAARTLAAQMFQSFEVDETLQVTFSYQSVSVQPPFGTAQ